VKPPLLGLAPREIRELPTRNGFPQLPSPPGWVITLDMVNAARDDDSA
jgi:hypothetical protein